MKEFHKKKLGRSKLGKKAQNSRFGIKLHNFFDFWHFLTIFDFLKKFFFQIFESPWSYKRFGTIIFKIEEKLGVIIIYIFPVVGSWQAASLIFVSCCAAGGPQCATLEFLTSNYLLPKIFFSSKSWFRVILIQWESFIHIGWECSDLEF